jgi:STE24 endopeptidase
LCYNPGVTAPVALDTSRQERARRYAALRRRLFLLDLGISGLLTLAWVVLGWSVALRDWLSARTDNPWLVVLGFGAVFFLSLQAAGLPLSFAAGYLLPHRFGQSTQSLAGWIKDQLLELVIAAALGVPLLLGLYWALRATGDAWWLWAAGGYLLVTVALAGIGPVVLMPLFNRYLPLREDQAELGERLRRLAERAGTRVSGVYRFDMSRRTRAANAALAGLGNTRRIILGDTLLDAFTADEVETVIAHELGHHVHRDIPTRLALSGVLMTAALGLTAAVLRWGSRSLGLAEPADVAGLPLLALCLGALGLLTLPLNNAYSRWRERRADEFALTATGKPQAFANAMTRLANQNLAEADPSPWVVALFYTHPPIQDRVAYALRWASRQA